MNQDHSEAVSNLGVLLLAMTFALLGWLQNHTMMRHGLFAAATWAGGVFAMRIASAVGLATLQDARLFNGWLAWLVLSMLIAAWVSTWHVVRCLEKE